MNIATMLQRLGYSGVAAEVFVALSKLKKASVTTIAATCGLFRPSVYRGLEALVTGGLVVVHTRGKRREYSAVHESDVLTQWRQLDVAVGKKVKNPTSTHASSIEVTTGTTAVRDAFDHVVGTLRRGDTFYRITSEKNLDEVNALLSTKYRTKRDAKRLERLVISNASSGHRKRNRLERFIRYIDEEKTPFHQNIIELIYGHFVAFIDVSKLEVVTIENSHLADFERAKFESHYRALPR